MKSLPLPDRLDVVPPIGHVCLITDDGTETTPVLAKTLSEQGWEKVVVLRFPESVVASHEALPDGIDHLAFGDLDPSSLERTLGDIRQKQGDIGAFIHLHPRFQSDSKTEVLFSELEKQVLKQVYFVAKHLKDPLNKAAQKGPSFFAAVTRLNGRLGLGESKNCGAIAGGLYGLVKTLNIEWNPVFCRIIDLNPELDPAASVETVMAELSDPDTRITEVGYHEGNRATLVAESVESPTESTGSPTTIDPSALFLVSGGAKGVTAACVTQLAAQYGCGFVLLGRSELSEDEPDWANECFDETELKKRCMEAFIAQGEKPTPVKIMNRLKPLLAGREIRTTLKAVEKAGSRVEYLSVDINNPEDLKRKLDPAVERLGPFTGIIHGAGVLADKLIEDKTEQDFEAVYSTKVDGLQSLLSSVSADRLNHLVLFSSAAGFYGNEAQSDYAAANEILDKFAHSFKNLYPACHVAAFNWGPWDGGMVTPELKRLFEQRKVAVIPIETGSKIMTDQLAPANLGMAQVVVGSSMIVPGELGTELETYRIRRRLTLPENAFLLDHVIGGESVLPVICVISWMADSCEQLYPGYRFFRCKAVQVLKGIVFNQTQADEYFLDIKETAKSESQGIEFQVKISSRNDNGKTVYHYSANVGLVAETPEIPWYEGFDKAETDGTEGSAFYRDGTLFHGPIFQIVDRMLNISSEKLTLECEAPMIDENQQGQFPARAHNPYADDGQLQALLVWARRFFQAGSLPLKVERGEFFRKIPFGEKFYISLDVQSSSQSKLVADVAAHDAKGEIYSRLYGAEAAISKNLNEKFLERSTD
ncbi:MAG: SDR family NAD(P)-dependent oxidoreductase [Proteobacteria bacterium]|nr:SDR family NAD(P)-dependent oxidoreductase [Pseudomonadota bacterium]